MQKCIQFTTFRGSGDRVGRQSGICIRCFKHFKPIKAISANDFPVNKDDNNEIMMKVQFNYSNDSSSTITKLNLNEFAHITRWKYSSKN